MKGIAIILFAALYLVSISGVAVSSFYCCGKLKETYVFYSTATPENCKGNKLPGCCDTKTTLVKVKDNHSPAAPIKINCSDAVKIFCSSLAGLNICTSYNPDKNFSTLIHAPPLPSERPVYLSVRSFRI